jgi:hypothetical protein
MVARVAAGILGLMLMLKPAIAQTTWEMPTPYPPSNFQTRNVASFIADVEAATSRTLDQPPPRRIDVQASGDQARRRRGPRGGRQC